MYKRYFYKIHIITCVMLLPLILIQYKSFKTYTLSMQLKYFISQKKKQNIQIISEQKKKIIELNSQILNLKNEINSIKNKNIFYHKMKEKYNIKHVADILYINITPTEKYIIITSVDAIKKNDLVIDKNNILIGRVIEKNKYTAKVQLILDISSNIPVFSGESDGIVYGINDKRCKIVFSNFSNKKPKNGDLVITSGFENLTMRGIIVGTIKNINGKFCVENENIYSADIVFVIS